MERVSWFVVVAGMMVGFAASASAQCMEGRVQTAEGFCCWPSQTFDTTRRACAGPPTCPAGRAAEGETCVATQPEFRPAQPAPAPSGAAPYPYGPAPGQYPYGAPTQQYGSPAYGAQPGWPSNNGWTRGGAPQPGSTRGRDALLIAGGVILAVSYVTAGLLGTFALGSETRCSGGYYYGCYSTYPAWAASWVPITPYFAMLGNSSYSNGGGWAMVISTGVSQLAGLIMLIAGAAMHTGPTTPPRPGFSLLPGAPDAPAGLTLDYTFF